MTEKDRAEALGQYAHAADEQAAGVADAITCGECPLDIPCMTVTGREQLPDGGVMVRACPIMAEAMSRPEGHALIEQLRRLARGGFDAR